MHHQQSGIDDSFAIRRHIRQTINGLVNRSVGIDVSTEIDSYRLEIVDDSLAREMLSAVKGHMLQEMRQTVLMVLFEDSTYGLRDMELAALLGLLVMTYIIRQTVV